MPKYEYSCKKCGTVEITHKITDDPVKKCPHCGEEIERLISLTAPPKFNGKGWYDTDYKKKT